MVINETTKKTQKWDTTGKDSALWKNYHLERPFLDRDSLLPSPAGNESIALVIKDSEDVLYYIEKKNRQGIKS